MNVYIEASFDIAAPDGPGESLVQWFRAARDRLFGGLVEAEATGGGEVVSEARVIRHIDDSPRRFPKVGETWEQFEEGLAAFPWGAGLSFLTDDGEPDERGRANSYHVLRDGSIWRASASASVDSPDDAESCAALVDFLRAALDASNPTFGRIEWRNFNELTNLDAVLRRKKRTSLRESRQFLRGYAWATVCPAELAARLGGATALENSGAFHRVLPMRAGGVLLQASDTLAGYTDQVMERVFETLAPVLPPGEPRPDPAFPYLRFVPRDAAGVR
ncbi:hypothetical protein [Streptomyces sp. Root369]|uniref:hypothetical protein n=1 Tax=Streptomyces sp. Root369 TaxID=1736523 RepID=UPI00070B7368|nr:hypothetical protein [Streptomyces sp. Root369]KQW06964.1 hypothetical protein ASD08_05090 [Streptomyces sp. Root369]